MASGAALSALSGGRGVDHATPFLPVPDLRLRFHRDGRHFVRIRLARIANASGIVLQSVVAEAVEPGAKVLTDGWKGYGGLPGVGYVHQVVRAAAVVGENLLPRANRVASLLQRWWLGTHQGAVAPSHLDYYLDEFTFRFNRRRSRSRGLLFYRLVGQALAVGPVRGRELVGGTTPKGLGLGESS